MSESEKRTPISIYLTPRAAMILKQYSMGSGYGSVSRTVEEMILAFDFTYNTIKDGLRTLTSKTKQHPDGLPPSEKTVMWSMFVLILTHIDSAISRLNKETSLIEK